MQELPSAQEVQALLRALQQAREAATSLCRVDTVSQVGDQVLLCDSEPRSRSLTKALLP